jgi:hypothetical protein
MKKSVKKRVGRPPGRKAPHRPVVSARVPESLYERIKREARTAGRTVGEELVWRAEQIYEWQEKYREAKDVLDEASRVTAAGLQTTLRNKGWQTISGFGGYAWFEPGVSPGKWVVDNANREVVEEIIERATTRAVKAVLESQGRG